MNYLHVLTPPFLFISILSESITSEPTQSSLLKQCKLVSEQVIALVQVLQTSLRKPEDTQAEVELVNTSKAFITVRIYNCIHVLQKTCRCYHKLTILG